MKPIAVLGVGPAGLMAAHAVALSGRPVTLLSQPEPTSGHVLKSRLGGAQFLHDPIPGINNEEEPDAVITYHVLGDVATYRKKVYGEDPTIPFVSMENVYEGKTQNAWNLQRTYDALWELLSVDKANAQHIDPLWLDLALEKEWFDLILSTIPMHRICRAHAGMTTELHTFVTQTVQIGDGCVWDEAEGNSIYYNGDPEYSWYRASLMFGVGGTEWGERSRTTPGIRTFNVEKPIRTNCNCYESSVVRLGRYGTWTKGTLTHHAFVGTLKALHERGWV